MYKNSYSKNFFLLVSITCLTCLMGMLYWSQLLLEEKMDLIQDEISQLHYHLLTNTTNQPKEIAYAPPIPTHLQKENLLEPDPFYSTTLPQLLGPDFKISGTMLSEMISKPEDVHPFTAWSTVRGWNRKTSLSLARKHFGKYETFAPNMATAITEGDAPGEFMIHLRNDVYWQPLSESMFTSQIHLAPHFKEKHLVTAHDYKFYYDAMMNRFNEKTGASYERSMYQDLGEFTVIDDFTLRVRWKTQPILQPDGTTIQKPIYLAKKYTFELIPLASFVYQYFPDGTKIIDDEGDPDIYRKDSVWGQNFSEHWAKNVMVSCGRWAFERFTDEEISFRRNDDHVYPNETLVKNIRFYFKNSQDSIWQDFKNGTLPYYEMSPQKLVELDHFLASSTYQKQAEMGQRIHRIDYPEERYYYIGWNQKNPLFKSKKVRHALSMAIDRKRIINQILNGMGVEITSHFCKFWKSSDPSVQPFPYDPIQARALLEEEGWYDRNGDGIISNVIDGEPLRFEFTLTYYIKHPMSKVISEFVAMELKELGIKVNLYGVDALEISQVVQDKNFDAIKMGWAYAYPPENPRPFWHSERANEANSLNYIHFSHPEADQILEALDYESDPEERQKLYYRFHAILHEEQPYTFLYTPVTTLLYRENLQNVFIPSKRKDLTSDAIQFSPDKDIFWLSSQTKN